MLQSEKLVDTLVDMTFLKEEASKGPTTGTRQTTKDGVYAYACGVLTKGLFLVELIDGIREGDGNRIIRCWHYLMMMFKRKNYAIEAFTLLMQYDFLFTPRMAAQLKWNRTVNVHGQPGKNISSDLHMEHLNRDAKMSISGMGSNVTEDSIKHVGRAMKPLGAATLAFDEQYSVPSSPEDIQPGQDMDKVVQQIFNQSQVFKRHPEEVIDISRSLIPMSWRN